MGAKIPVRLKSRRVTCKCDVCGSSFQNIQALRTHQAYSHPKTKRVAYKPKTEVIAKRKTVILKKPKVAKSKPLKLEKNVKEKEKQVQTPKSPRNQEKAPKVIDESKEVNDLKRNGFECPVCFKVFTVYFSAYRHIQNIHCVNDLGEAVSPNSSSLIKPVQIEQCITCNAKFDKQHHKCSDSLTFNEENARLKQTCLGCKREFLSMDLFAKHIAKEHKAAESIFFPDINKFMTWKKSMEIQTATKYSAMKKSDDKDVQIYHCNHFTSKNTTSMFCPGSIIQHEYPKGVKVTYYKEHFGHTAKEYTTPDGYQKYVITYLLANTNNYPKNKNNVNDQDLYSELKRLMENIVINAAKLDESMLKLLMGKALEMTTVLNCKKDDEEQNVNPTKTITDEEISKLLTEPKKNKVPTEPKKNKVVTEPKKNKRKSEDDDTNVKKVKLETVAKVEPRVVSNSITSKSTSEKTDAKEPVKETRQYLSTRSNQQLKLEATVKDTKNNVKSPSSFSETYQNFIDVNFKSTPQTETSKPKKKESLKTKIGQFKPSITKNNKDDKVQDSSTKLRFSKLSPKIDLKYEVLERENDCNILIIKI